MTSNSLLQAWSRILARRGGDTAIHSTNGEVLRSFSDIDAEAMAFAGGALAAFAEGQVIGLQAGNHPSWPGLLLACLQRGLVALPLERSISEQERDAAIATCSAAAVLTVGGDDRIAVTPCASQPVDWRDCPPSMLKLTSGTTAAPRAIRFRSDQLLADCEQICDTMGISDCDLNFAVIPISHSYGFSNLITPLLVRGVPMVLSSDRMPRAVLDDLARTGATVFPGMPVFYQAFCEMERVPDLPHLRLCISAGAPLPLPIAQRFREKFGQAIHSFYGSSECGGICYDRAAPLVEQGFVGDAMDGVELEPLDPSAASSLIRVRSAAAGDGYFPVPEEAKLSDGCFVPDDLLARRTGGY
nr:acyl--CoA ligase [Chthoniobacterales bacterium]